MNIAQKMLRKQCRTIPVRELAERIGVGRAYLYEVLAGTKEPGPTILEYLNLERYWEYRPRARAPAARRAAA